MTAKLGPVTEGDRVELFDTLRGFALLGILLVNFWGDEGTTLPRVNSFVSDALDILISGSFYPLYSFLFGLGFAVQLARAKDRGSGTAHLFFRRMLVLFLIGTVHVVLIWDGDILVAYSILGLALIPLHRLPQKAVLLLAVAMYLASVQRLEIRQWASARAESNVLAAAAIGLEERIANSRNADDAVPKRAAYVQSVRNGWRDHMRDIRGRTDWVTWVLSDILLFFLIGLMVGKSRILHEAALRKRTLARATAVATVLGVGGAVAYNLGWLDGPPWVNALGYDLANPWLTAFYVLAITMLFTFTASGRRIFAVFIPPGRMGLTNYLMQSVVMVALTAPYAIGWKLSTTAWVALNLVFFFGVQVPLSRWWLARYRYGPMEWVWRSATYGVAQPLRVVTIPLEKPG